MTRRSLLLGGLAAVTGAAIGCGRAGSDETRPAQSTPVDAIVDPADIHFDTFDGGSVPLSEASSNLIDDLRDIIPPIDDPIYSDASTGEWLDGGDLVLGYISARGQPYAYPVKILNFHEIVNDEIDGIPVLVSYCPLCRSGVVFDRRLGGRTLSFGNTSALYENGMVMVDRQTDSFWWHVSGQALTGELAGEKLALLASILVPWDVWRVLYPHTLILTRDTGFDRPYGRDSFGDSYANRLNQGRFAFPVSDAVRDNRLPPGELVLGVTIDGKTAAFALKRIGDAAVNVDVTGHPVVVFAREAGPAGAAYSRVVDGRQMDFSATGAGFVDDATSSVWDFTGVATSGPLAGTALDPVPSHTMFWFAHIAAYPDTELHR